MSGQETCPDIAQHTPAPAGYVAWHEWAEQMSKTHRTRRCPGCGLYKIWEPIKPGAKKAPATEWQCRAIDRRSVL